MLIDGGSRVNIITKNLRIQLGLPKPNPTLYNPCMENQTITKPFGLIRDLKIFVYGISYIVTFIVNNSNVLNSSYSMLFGHPWLKDAKVIPQLGNQYCNHTRN